MLISEEYLREDLLEIYKNPSNMGKIQTPSVSVRDTNPMCGDEIHLDLLIENGILKDAKYHGNACAVSVIASSLVTEEIIGMPVVEVKNLKKQDILDLIGVELTTSRVKCATLVFLALHKALEQYDQQNSK